METRESLPGDRTEGWYSTDTYIWRPLIERALQDTKEQIYHTEKAVYRLQASLPTDMADYQVGVQILDPNYNKELGLREDLGEIDVKVRGASWCIMPSDALALSEDDTPSFPVRLTTDINRAFHDQQGS